MDNNIFSSQQQMEMQAGVNAYISKIFGTMFLGLLITAIAAFFSATNETMINLLWGNSLVYAFIIAELVIVLVLSNALPSKVDTFSPT